MHSAFRSSPALRRSQDRVRALLVILLLRRGADGPPALHVRGMSPSQVLFAWTAGTTPAMQGLQVLHRERRCRLHTCAPAALSGRHSPPLRLGPAFHTSLVAFHNASAASRRIAQAVSALPLDEKRRAGRQRPVRAWKAGPTHAEHSTDNWSRPHSGCSGSGDEISSCFMT